MPWFEQYIAHYDGVQGGAAVITGTRTPVRSIVAAYHISAGDGGDILSGLPHLSETQVQAALAYYQQHQAEIDADVERHQRALEEFLKTAAPVAR
ncbi:MAG TPA: DUF433 domain-containing protein [Chloroflexota bacterium]|jgi:uncharacterized protein (DUF433 family)|nr:DUF433 domain-containing protein [Chloroflexota bacterium]